VKTAAGATGWVHLFDVGPASGAGSAGSSGGAAGALRSVTSLFTKPSQRAATPTSTIGIRGLGAEDLAQAQPDAAALAKMDALRQDEAQARRFARGASLAAARVDPLPAPARAAAPANPTQAGNPGQMP
jgi:hypothetical protein